jgi:hypothetical protein
MFLPWMYDLQEKSSSSFFNLPFPNNLGMFSFFCLQWLKKELLRKNKSKVPYPHPNFSHQLHITPSSHYHLFLQSCIQVPLVTLVVQW